MNPPRRWLFDGRERRRIVRGISGHRTTVPCASRHHDRPGLGRRTDRRDRPRDVRAHDRQSRRHRAGRQRRWRRRLDRRRQGRALDGRRLYAGHRPVEPLRAERRHLRLAVRPARRLRAGRPDRHWPDADREPQGPAGQRHEGPDRLAEGQPRQGDGRHRRRRRPGAHLRHLLPEADRHALPVRALPRHRPGDARSSGRPDRHHARPGLERAAAAARRHHQGVCRHRQGAAGVGAGGADRR